MPPSSSVASSAAAQPSASRPAAGRGLVLVLGTLSAFGPLSLDLYLPGLPSVADDLGASASATQATLTACLLGLASGQLFAGPLSDARGRRRPLLLGVLAYVVASVACALAPSIGTLIALRFVQGLAGSAGIVISRAIVRDLHSGKEAARLYAALQLVNSTAPIVAPILGSALLRVMGWRGLFLVLAGLGALILTATGRLVAESHPPSARAPGHVRGTLATMGGLLRDARFTGCMLACAFALAALFAYIAGSPFVLQDIYGLSPTQFSFVFAGNSLGILVLAAVAARLLRRRSPVAVLGVGLGVGLTGGVALLVVVATGVAGLAGVLPALFLVVSCVGLVLPSATAIAMAGHPAIAGTAAALLGVAQYAMGAVSAPLVGLGGRETAVPMAAVICVCGAVALAAWALLVRPRAALAR